MTEEATKVTEAGGQKEHMNKNKMTGEETTKIAEIVSKIQKPELLRIEAILACIEHSIAASKEMSEIYFKDIDR
eukprot:1126044-Heterocapsa_arctica.AAC.1